MSFHVRYKYVKKRHFNIEQRKNWSQIRSTIYNIGIKLVNRAVENKKTKRLHCRSSAHSVCNATVLDLPSASRSVLYRLIKASNSACAFKLQKTKRTQQWLLIILTCSLPSWWRKSYKSLQQRENKCREREQKQDKQKEK